MKIGFVLGYFLWSTGISRTIDLSPWLSDNHLLQDIVYFFCDLLLLFSKVIYKEKFHSDDGNTRNFSTLTTNKIIWDIESNNDIPTFRKFQPGESPE